jgi:hypothetical protein
MEFKTSGVVKDVDMAKREVAGYFSVFGNVDADGDIMDRSAYNKTLEGGIGRVQHLFMHSPMLGSVGKIKELTIDDKGLFFRSKIIPTSMGNDLMVMYDEQAIKEHSVGFETLKSEPLRQQDGTDIRVIKEVRLWEGSSVLWGANPEALRKSFDLLHSKGEDEGLYTFIKSQLEAINESLEKVAANRTTSQAEHKSLLEIYSELKTK